MHDNPRLPESIQRRLDTFLADQRDSLRELGPDFAPLMEAMSAFLAGGKRLRGQFLSLGFEAVSPRSSDVQAVIDAACALELFHAAALIHDDLIDQSDTRRGSPSVHRSFQDEHVRRGFKGSSERYGQAVAILVGDLLQSWADELMQHALDSLTSREDAQLARRLFNRMRSEVAVGQFLDVLEEQLPHFAADQVQLERSTRVLIYKSAKYSVQAPLLIGATMAGANPDQVRALSDFGLPVGVAFQLRDDVLGIFGDEHVTGKPTGDDLTEGKRTVLVTLARERLTSSTRRLFDELFGSENLETQQIAMLQRTIKDTGALDRVEDMIKNNVGIGREALAEADLDGQSVRSLLRLADFVAERKA